jgi:predicted NBD/HSP70 family sugar kinase
MCPFVSVHHSGLISHVIKFHKHDPNLRLYCSVDGCSETYGKIESLRKHMKRKHQDIELGSVEVAPNNNEDLYDVNTVEEEVKEGTCFR